MFGFGNNIFWSKTEDIMTLSNVDVLISGGIGIKPNTKVELFNLITKTTCELEDLPEIRLQHTSVNGDICGGMGVETCIDISSGSWSSEKFQNITPRLWPISWNINPGESFMILGGDGFSTSMRSTDIVYTNGTVEAGFSLPYEFR